MENKCSFTERQLKIFNSFSKKKEVFVPNDRKTVKWYCCGPTVYDVSHLGHARCYITFDIIRRILEGYFGYHVFYVMNITDIDDKIIKRARSDHLYNEFICESLNELFSRTGENRANISQKFVEQLQSFINNYQRRNSGEQDRDKLTMIDGVLKKSMIALKELELQLAKKFTEADIRLLLVPLKDVIADEQDFQLAHTIYDHQVFKNLTLKFEQEYHDDMEKIDVQPPSALTRVSEFIHEIGEYIVRLEQNGFAYRTAGSIYFDTEKFDSDEKHSYAKLVREAYGHKKDLDVGEGELSIGHQDKKKSPNDFALWKKSKVGEPSWQTQDFEAGRPGWHIECSVMASRLLGENFDIHSGGHDLKFPHHDNEIAQAEAYYNTGKNWVNYFVHSGHLTISGCKMSKSLKNFITIRQALEDYSSRQLRFAFLSHGWTETLDYSSNTMSTAFYYEKTFREFFLNTSVRSRSLNNDVDQSCKRLGKWAEDDHQLNDEFLNTVNRVDAALCDSFDTRSTLNALVSLIKECNKREKVDLTLILDIAKYIHHILSIFGTKFDEMNLVTSSQENRSYNHGPNNEESMKYVDALARFRADIRRISKGGDAQHSIKQILELCDNLRDQTLPNLGVRLEDRESGDVPYAVKFVDAQTLAREKRELEKKLAAQTQQMQDLTIKQHREEKAKMPPSQMFRSQVDKYSIFDSNGLPTHDSVGKELSKSALKKLIRLYAEQEKRYNNFIKSERKQS